MRGNVKLIIVELDYKLSKKLWIKNYFGLKLLIRTNFDLILWFAASFDLTLWNKLRPTFT